MTLLPILVIISFSMLTTIRALNYTVTRILSETLTLHKNTRFLLEEIGEGNDSTVYMTINEPITEADDLLIDTVAERFDGVKYPIVNNPMKLCDILSEELATNSTSHVQQLHVSRVFNLEGETCPILPGKRKLIPYMFPTNLNLSNDIGCGDFNFNIDIESIDSNDASKYVPLISSSTIVHIMAEHCSNTLM